MSVTNWAVCPQCLARAKKRHADEQAKLTACREEAYDRVSSALYASIPRTPNWTVRDSDYETFREDYSVGVYLGKFAVEYYGKCQTCGFKKEFDHEESLVIAEEVTQREIIAQDPAPAGQEER